jgi:hypothetical protein
MTDLRAERRAIAAQLLTSFCDGGITQVDICDAYKDADAIIQHDLDNPPVWEKPSITAGEAWQHGYDSAKLEEAFRDGYVSGQEAAPSGWVRADIPVSGNITINSLDGSVTDWVRATDRLPTEADAPREQVWVADDDDGAVYLKDAALATLWDYWHPATGIYQIPEPPAPLEPPK